MKRLLSNFHLTNKIISYVKDEGSNFKTLALDLTSVVSCKPLALLQPYPGVCCGHIMSKACHYCTHDTKVCIGMKKVPIKEAQTNLYEITGKLKPCKPNSQVG